MERDGRGSARAKLDTGPVLYCFLSMRSVQFRTTARAAAWLLLALVALDLGNPSLCALDQEGPSFPVSPAAALDARSTDDSAPARTIHIDDCFCCSHCVDVSSFSALVPLAFIDSRVPLPTDAPLGPAGHPPYHPPRA